MIPQDQVPTPPAPIVPAQLIALREQAALISQQLSQARDRRTLIQNDLKTAGPAQARELNLQLRSIDQELGALEAGLSRVNTQIAQLVVERDAVSNAPPGTPVINVSPPPGPRGGDNAERVAAIMAMLVLVPLAIAFAIRIVRRGRPQRVESAESSDRLNRIENAVDAIAIEVERISEHQRFLTQAMTSDVASLPPRREAEPVRRHTTPV